MKIKFVLLLVAILAGVYIVITPPWWHHDESGHFQVAWFYSVYGRFPGWEEYDPVMREELALSLDANRFYEFRNYKLDLGSETPPWVMSPQFNDPKLSYYVYAAAFSIFNKPHDLVALLYIGRVISAIYLVLTVWLIWLTAVVIFGDRSKIPWMSAIIVGLLPGFLNQMTAFSNEPLGTLVFTAFVYFSVRILREKKININILFLILFALLGIATTRNILLPIIILVPIVLFNLVLSSKKVLSIFAIFFVLFFIGVSQFKEAKYWYSTNPNLTPTTIKVTRPYGDTDVNKKYAMELDSKTSIIQRIPSNETRGLENTNLIIGFTAWSDGEPIKEKLSNILSFNYGRIINKNLLINNEPQRFYTYLSLPEKIGNLKIFFKLRPVFNNSSLIIDDIYLLPENEIIYFDKEQKLVLFNESDNLIRNSSFENKWITIKPDVFSLINKFFPQYSLSSSFVTVFDINSSGWYFDRTFQSLVESFFGKVGASNFEIFDWNVYLVFFFLLFLLITAGMYSVIFENQNDFIKSVFWFFGTILILIWIQVILRGTGSIDTHKIVIPWARYGLSSFPVIGIIISFGFDRIRKHHKSGDKYILFLFWLIVVTLNYFFIFKALEMFYV